MSRKSLQLLMSAAMAAALGMFGTAAHATFYTAFSTRRSRRATSSAISC